MENEYNHDGGSKWYEFNGETFMAIADPTPNDEVHFDKALAAAGFDLPGQVFPSEFSNVNFGLTRCSKDKKILVCIGDADEGLGQIVCTDLIAWMKFMRDYVKPICEVQQITLMHQAFDKVESTVFDSEVGIECAVREAERSRANWQRRKKT